MGPCLLAGGRVHPCRRSRAAKDASHTQKTRWQERPKVKFSRTLGELDTTGCNIQGSIGSPRFPYHPLPHRFGPCFEEQRIPEGKEEVPLFEPPGKRAIDVCVKKSTSHRGLEPRPPPIHLERLKKSWLHILVTRKTEKRATKTSHTVDGQKKP